ncbi:putative Acyltransferase 3 [Mesorhizobium prunaredense]|uniref:Putative Acyltransferase 3 n=1 Tax=Mesorhizobium prunaredense TaxID=1631249 RepID=A0A1R3V2E4_9HYPH|nr:acyltransferase [Mesorhizobium prunaredense]SIT54072.1 putative Acyltransferase 3 [Mesorhizobium prunaredense]
MQATADGRNNPWLDLLRSIAIVLVVLRHGEQALHLRTGEPLGVIQTIFMNGWVGVDLFFVLSGYLIARHLVRAGIGSGRFGLARYLVMRVLRIVPAYYAVLLLVAMGAFPLFPVDPNHLGLRVAYHLLFLQDYMPSDINVVFWSLGVEEKFYLLAPLLVLALLRCRSTRLRASLIVLLFCLPIALRTAAYLSLTAPLDYPTFWRLLRSPFHMALEGLVVGVAIAVAEHAGILRLSRRAAALILFAAATLLAIWLGSEDFMARIDPTDAILQPPLIALLAAAMTLGAVGLAGTPMPCSGPFRTLSRLSYSLYLVHYPLIPAAMAVASLTWKPGFWLYYLSFSLCAAMALHLTVERPFLLLKDKLGSRERLKIQGAASNSALLP